MTAFFKRRVVPILVILFGLSVQTGCNQENPDVFGPSVTVSDITVQVDYRIEALTVIQLLAGYPLLTQIQSTFREEVEKYFSPMKKHPAVLFIRDHWKNGVAYEKPVYMVMLLGEDLKPAFDLPHRVEESVGGKQIYSEFTLKFADFYRSKEFQEFLSSKKDFYRNLVTKIVPVIEQTQAANQLVSYYGYKKGGFRIVFSPLLHGGGFGPSIQTSATDFVTCSVMGPISWSPSTGFEFGDTNRFKYLIWHEFSHSYLNPIIDRNLEEVNRYSSLFEPIQDEMGKNAYGSWTTCLYEHLVRAATIRLGSLHISAEQGERDMQSEIDREFIYIPGILDAFKYYEEHRDQYRVIDDLGPVILRVLHEYSEGSRIARKSDRLEYVQSVRGDEGRFIETGYPNINFVAKNINKKNGYVILPTHETDRVAQELVVKDARAFWSRYPGIEFLTDDQALARATLGHHVVAYGTPLGNSWIGKIISSSPLSLSSASIKAVDEHSGKDLRLILATKNPYEPNYFVLVYTAQNASDIHAIQDINHGGQCYLIARGLEVLEEGFFWIENDKVVPRKK